MGDREPRFKPGPNVRYGSKADIPHPSHLCPLLGAKRTSQQRGFFIFYIAGFAPSRFALDPAFLRGTEILRNLNFRPDGAVGPPPRLRWGPLAVKSGPIGPTSPRRHWSSLDIDFAVAILAENRRFLSKYRAYQTIWKITGPTCGLDSTPVDLCACTSHCTIGSARSSLWSPPITRLNRPTLFSTARRGR